MNLPDFDGTSCYETLNIKSETIANMDGLTMIKQQHWFMPLQGKSSEIMGMLSTSDRESYSVLMKVYRGSLVDETYAKSMALLLKIEDQESLFQAYPGILTDYIELKC